MLHEDIEVLTAPLDCAWLRDSGPTFVLNEAGELGAVDRVVNGWGQQEWTAPDGSPWNIVDIHAPATLKDEEGGVDYSCVNHPVVNGGVIACSFGDENDAAAEVLAKVYPGSKVVSVDARNIFAYGDGIHCITQHQPKSTKS